MHEPCIERPKMDFIKNRVFPVCNHLFWTTFAGKVVRASSEVRAISVTKFHLIPKYSIWHQSLESMTAMVAIGSMQKL